MNSCDDGLVKWDSVKSIPDTFDNVPQDQKFKMIFTSKGMEVERLSYTLRKGRPLPVSRTLENKDKTCYYVKFSCELKPSFEGFEEGVEENGFWCFEKSREDLDLSLSPVRPRLSPVLPRLSPVLPRKRKENFSQQSCSTSLDTSSSSQPTEEQASFLEDSQHDDAREMPLDISSPSPEKTKSTRKTAHTDPWLEDLDAKFMELIIEDCSLMTKTAVANNEILKKSDHRTVKNEIINSVLKYLKTFFTLENLPGIKAMRHIAIKLSHVYPVMFYSTEDLQPDQEKPDKLDDLAAKMRERLRAQLRRSVASVEEEGKDPAAKKKKGGKVQINYGTDTAKWNKEVPACPDAITALNSTHAEANYEKREAVFEKYREVLTANFKKSKRSIPTILKPFFKDHRHLAKEWEYLTAAEPLYSNVEKNYVTQFGNIEKFLIDQDRSVEFQEALAGIEQTCQVEHSGATTWKDINLLRFFSKHFDGSDAELIRLESDGDHDGSGSPHIFVIESDKGVFIFEVWVDGQMLLGNLNFVTAISSFLHLCFCFDLHFPRGGETTADLLQRGFARYGDNSGSRTSKNSTKAAKKLDKYHLAVGRLQ